MLEIFIRWLEKILWKFSFQIFIIREEPGCLGTKRHSKSQKNERGEKKPKMRKTPQNQILKQTKPRGRGAAFPAGGRRRSSQAARPRGRGVCVSVGFFSFFFWFFSRRAGQEICRGRARGGATSVALMLLGPSADTSKEYWVWSAPEGNSRESFHQPNVSCGIRTVKLYLHTDS